MHGGRIRQITYCLYSRFMLPTHLILIGPGSFDRTSFCRIGDAATESYLKHLLYTSSSRTTDTKSCVRIDKTAVNDTLRSPKFVATSSAFISFVNYLSDFRHQKCLPILSSSGTQAIIHKSRSFSIFAFRRIDSVQLWATQSVFRLSKSCIFSIHFVVVDIYLHFVFTVIFVLSTFIYYRKYTELISFNLRISSPSFSDEMYIWSLRSSMISLFRLGMLCCVSLFISVQGSNLFIRYFVPYQSLHFVYTIVFVCFYRV